MDNFGYVSVIADLCQIVGVQEWECVARSQHITLNNQLVGLIFDEAVDAEKIFVYFDLGAWPGAPAYFERSLLEANLIAGKAATGCFGLHPHSGHIVYLVKFDVKNQPHIGAGLAELLASTPLQIQHLLSRHSAGTYHLAV